MECESRLARSLDAMGFECCDGNRGSEKGHRDERLGSANSPGVRRPRPLPNRAAACWPRAKPALLGQPRQLRRCLALALGRARCALAPHRVNGPEPRSWGRPVTPRQRPWTVSLPAHLVGPRARRDHDSSGLDTAGPVAWGSGLASPTSGAAADHYPMFRPCLDVFVGTAACTARRLEGSMPRGFLRVGAWCRWACRRVLDAPFSTVGTASRERTGVASRRERRDRPCGGLAPLAERPVR